MTSARDNADLTRAGPGTLMGDLMRQYWIPACLSSEREPGAPPMRLLLLGQQLIAFRDRQGRIGIMDHRCPHRSASLFFGRMEGGRIVRCHQRECNWLQALEGDIDTSHLSFLHVGSLEAHEIPADSPHRYNLIDRAPRYHVEDTDWGTMYTAYRPVGEGQVYHRFSHFIFPFVTLPPDGTFADHIQGGTYSGIQGLVAQDQAVTESMGAVVDRSREHLAASNLRDHGTVPPGVDCPEVFRIARSGAFLAPGDQDWYEAYLEHLETIVGPLQSARAAE